MRRGIYLALLPALAGCATTDPVSVCQPFDIARQVGKTWVRSAKNTGSFGSTSAQTTHTRQPKRTWQGHEVFASLTAGGPTLLQDPDGGPVAVLDGDKLVTTWDRPPALQVPAAVGTGWTKAFSVTNHVRNETVAFEERWTVEAMENVTVAGGTFRTCRLRSVDNRGNDNLHWLGQDNGVFVKQRLTRTSQHASGPGTRETEIVSENISKSGY